MQRFLEACATYLSEQRRGNFDGLCLVFPNRRAALFFRAYLMKLLKVPVIGPAMTTINEWVMSFSGLLPGEPLGLVATLYETWLEQTGREEPFDEFYYWGEVILSDFDDIDKYLVQAKDLFSNLSDLKELGDPFDYLTAEQRRMVGQFWGTLASWEDFSHEKEFVTVWEKLYGIYAAAKGRLAKNGSGYAGMIMRDGVENLFSGKVEPPFREYWFVGMNALNPCEKKMFSWFRERGRARFFWDYDLFFLDNLKNDAGQFMRENVRLFPSPPDFSQDVSRFSRPKTIKLVAVASSCGQAQVIPSFMENCGTHGNAGFDHTAIVLADESLLFPVLGAIPPEAGPVNVTMGYPVRNTPVVSLLHSVISLFRNAKPGVGGIPRFYFRQVMEILTHPLVDQAGGDRVRLMIREIKTRNKIYLTPDELGFSDLHTLIFSMPASVSGYPAYFLRLLERLYANTAGKEEQQVLQELLYSLYQAMEKMDTLIRNLRQEGKAEVTLPVFFRLLTQYLNRLSVPFEGEPLSGLQVMGILETRCLDFDKVLIIGLNEEKWPKAPVIPSMIPFHLRKGFGLPGADDQDAMYGYYFYRLLQHPGKVIATWSAAREALSGGELSRYGYQLMMLSPHKVVRQSLDYAFTGTVMPAVAIRPGRQGAEQLLASNQTGAPLSPSALISFLTCPLKFWFRYGVGLKEPEEISDTIDRLTFGNIFHRAVELLYEPLVGRLSAPGDFDEILHNRAAISRAIRKAFASAWFVLPETEWEQVLIEGQALLIYAAIESYLDGLLELDRQMAPLKIVGLEKKVEITQEILINGNPRKIRIGGKIDRLDEINGILRVVDYKTGALKPADLNFSSLEDLFDRSQKILRKEIIQALLYSYLLKKEKSSSSRIVPVVYAVLSIREESFDFRVRKMNQAVEIGEIEQAMELQLDDILAGIYGEDPLFAQTIHTDRCRNCPYNSICRL